MAIKSPRFVSGNLTAFPKVSLDSQKFENELDDIYWQREVRDSIYDFIRKKIIAQIKGCKK